MKKTIVFFAMLTLSIACKKENNSQNEAQSEIKDTLTYQSFGENITSDETLSKEEMLAKYENMKAGDTLQVKFASNINTTCKKKGCWMTLKLPNEQEAFVKFKDYAFLCQKKEPKIIKQLFREKHLLKKLRLMI